MDSEKYRKKYMRTCSFCGEEKPIEQMYDDSECMQCRFKELEVIKKLAKKQIRADRGIKNV